MCRINTPFLVRHAFPVFVMDEIRNPAGIVPSNGVDQGFHKDPMGMSLIVVQASHKHLRPIQDGLSSCQSGCIRVWRATWPVYAPGQSLSMPGGKNVQQAGYASTTTAKGIAPARR